MRSQILYAVPARADARLFEPATLVRLYRARDYLAAAHSQDLVLEDAAREAALSPYYFNRLFTLVFNETPHEFLTRVRIHHAKRLLGGSDRSVTEICLDVGYQSLGSFSTRFRSLTSLSPTAFRREAWRVFGGFGKWSWFYVPGCFHHFFSE